MTIRILIRKIFPIRKGSDVEVFATGPNGTGRYHVQQIKVDTEGIVCTDYRKQRVSLKIKGTVLKSEVNNNFQIPSTEFFTHIDLEDETIEKLEYPHFLLRDNHIIVTNLITKRRETFQFKKDETYAEIIQKHGGLGSKEGYIIVDEDLTDIGNHHVADNPVPAYIYPEENEDQLEGKFDINETW